MKLEWKTCLKVGVTLFLLYLCIHLLPGVLGFGAKLLGTMSSILIGAAIAYLVNLLMNFYERHYFFRWQSKKFFAKSKRPVCLTLAFLTLIALITLICILIVPELTSCIQTLIAVVPPFIKRVLTMAEDVSWIPKQIIDALESIDWTNWINKVVSFVSSGVGDVVSFVTSAVASVFSIIVTALFSVIFSIYLLTGKDLMKRNSLRLLSAYLPEKPRKRLLHLLAVVNDCFHRYIVGQCIEAVILGVLCTLGMLLFRLPYATMIGAFIAFTALIPVAGAYIGAGVGAFMILTVSPMKALFFILFIIVLQQLEGNLIYPRVVGSSLGLPSIWVLVAVTVGGGLYGVLGMLLGVPLVASIYRLVKEDLAKREDLAMRSEAMMHKEKEDMQSTDLDLEPSAQSASAVSSSQAEGD